jgi:hypothetical protein
MNFNLNRLLILAYMSRNFSSTVIRSCPKAIFNKLWDQFPTDVRTTILANQVTPKYYFISTAENFLILAKKISCGKYWR